MSGYSHLLRISSIFTGMIVLAVLLLCTSVMEAQPLRFSPPLEGVLGKDYYIVNHVDHDSRPQTIRDYSCGIQTYDGHDGTDFVLRSFKQMDSGLYVIAAADGEVLSVLDSLLDRNKVSVVERGFGNFIAIRHPEGYISYYAHIRKNSARVAVGTRVKRGDRIALVGSSGNSSDPHLHFEVWKREDPFSGACAGATSMWLDQPNYTTEYLLVDADVTTWPGLLDTLRERPPHATILKDDSTVTFWSLQQGIAATDLIDVEWLTPEGTSWFRTESTTGVNSHYFYWWSYILRPTQSGVWTVIQRVNGTERARVKFTVASTTSVAPREAGETPFVSVRDGFITTWPQALSIALYTLDGRLLSSTTEATLNKLNLGVSVLRVVFPNGKSVSMLVQ